MAGDSLVKLTGVIDSVGRGGLFKVLVNMPTIEDESNVVTVTANCSGKMKMHNIKLVAGDRVDVEVSPYYLQKGRIVHRHKS